MANQYAVRRMVFDIEDREAAAADPVGFAGRRRAGGCGGRGDGSGGQWQVDPETAAHARAAGKADPAAHRFDQPPAQHQTEDSALDLAELEMGRASCGETECKDVWVSVVT